jgi:hypothetical protein
MRSGRLVFAVVPFLIVSLAAPRSVRAALDDPEDIEKELAEKVAKALKRAAEEQRKTAEREAKRAKEAREEAAEAQEDAQHRTERLRKKAAEREHLKRDDPGKYEDEVLDDDLEDGVEDYVKKIHDKALKQAPPVPDKATPEQIATHQRALADAIRAMRTGAKQGDFFTPDVQAIIKRLVAAELDGKVGAPARREILSGNPPVDPDRDDRMQIRLAVNAPYPAAAPLSTVPPTVLLTLPVLKKQVEYRFVNRDLVLLDVEANLILDFMRNAAPPLVATGSATRR